MWKIRNMLCLLSLSILFLTQSKHQTKWVIILIKLALTYHLPIWIRMSTSHFQKFQQIQYLPYTIISFTSNNQRQKSNLSMALLSALRLLYQTLENYRTNKGHWEKADQFLWYFKTSIQRSSSKSKIRTTVTVSSLRWNLPARMFTIINQ